MAADTINLPEFLINLFVVIDDLLRCLRPKIGTSVGRTPSLNQSEVITLALFGVFAGFKTRAHLYAHIRNYHFKDFPRLPKYKNFNALINRHVLEAAEILQILMAFNRKNSSFSIKFMDSTAVAVCKNKRIFHHKVCEGVAKRGMSSFGWFFGFKIHICVDEQGRLLSIQVTPGNTDDREPVLKLLKDIQGLVVADSGYVSDPLVQKLYRKGIHFLTGVKKNMKKLMTKEQHKTLKLRQIVETALGVNKSSNNLVSSYARSVLGHFSRILYAFLAYALRFLHHPDLPAIS